MVDATGAIRLVNARLCDLLMLDEPPATLEYLLRETARSVPELRMLLDFDRRLEQAQWGNLLVQKNPPRRLNWHQSALFDGDELAGVLTVFRDANAYGQLELAKQSFLSMISHDLRTPLSTILGFAELLYHNQGHLSDDEQAEFLEHIIKNATQLSRYTQIALDIMFLEANMQSFDMEPVFLHRFVKHWLSDAVHRFPAERLVYHNGTPDDPMTRIAPAALHKILSILVEFALAESPPGDPVNIHLDYDRGQAHVTVQHQAPGLSAAEAAGLFRLMVSRDLSELGRPPLHRMQLYVASLLAERQHGSLILRSAGNQVYQIVLALPLVSVEPV